MKSRFLNTLMALSLSFSMMIPTAVYAQEEEEVEEVVEENVDDNTEAEEVEETVFGVCGDDASFEWDGKGTLTISGNGKITDITGWETFKDEIRKVIIEEGITEIPTKAFKDCTKLVSVKIADSVTYVGSLCFAGCSSSLVVDLADDMDTTNWAEDWYDEKVVEDEIVEDEEVDMDHVHITEDFEPRSSEYIIQIDGDDCFLPGETKTYTASLYHNVGGVYSKVEGASFVFSETSNYVDFTKNSGDTCSVKVQSNALTNNVPGFWLRCEVSYGTFKDEAWKYVFIEKEYFTLNVTGLAQDEAGNYVLNKGRSRDFTINVDRHYNNGSKVVVEPVSKDIDVNVEATNMEFYDSSKKQVYVLKANTTYSMKHIATSTDIIKFSTWIPTSTDPIECTQDITVTTTTGENELLGYSLSLSGDIAIHYYLALAEDISSDPNTHMTFTMPNGTSSTVYVKDAVKTKANGMDCYVFTHKVSAKNMTSVVSSTLYDGENNVVEESEYSVEKYCDYIFAHPDSFSAKQTDIAKAMLTYGYYAQQYFGYNTDKLPKTISPLQDVDFTPYAYQNVDSNPDLEFVGARLVLTSKPGLKLYFKGNADLLLNGSAAPTTQEGVYTVITISDIDDMSTMYMVMADSYNLTYGMFSFANQAMKGTNTDLKNLMKAMYAYNSYFK